MNNRDLYSIAVYANNDLDVEHVQLNQIYHYLHTILYDFDTVSIKKWCDDIIDQLRKRELAYIENGDLQISIKKIV